MFCFFLRTKCISLAPGVTKLLRRLHKGDFLQRMALMAFLAAKAKVLGRDDCLVELKTWLQNIRQRLGSKLSCGATGASNNNGLCCTVLHFLCFL